ncbi:MAG: polyprenol monophosphomannose synthase [Dehalococcoidia bacterium]
MKVSVIIPTWNERDNVGPLLRGVAQALEGHDFDIVVVDDSSPDGTAQVVRELSHQDGRIRLLTREGKLGLASAVLDGMALASGEALVVMDADLSHPPEALPHLLRPLEDSYAVVVGSRYVPGGRIEGWPPLRRLSSRLATLLAKGLLGLAVKDPMSGFAAFRRNVLEQLPTRYSARGFKLLAEVLATTPGLRVAEVPITFTDRTRGRSKFSLGEVGRFGLLCLRLWLWRQRNLPRRPRGIPSSER